jgi:hypothetical protein
MDIIQVDQYESDTSDEEIIEKNGNKIIHKKQKKIWVKEATFNTGGEAQASIKNEWSKHYTNYTECGKESINGSHWRTSKCNCPAFLKNYICKHVVGMGI